MFNGHWPVVVVLVVLVVTVIGIDVVSHSLDVVIKATIVGNSGIAQAYLYCVFNDCCLKQGSE